MGQLIYISGKPAEGVIDMKSLDFDGATEFLANTAPGTIGISNSYTIAGWVFVEAHTPAGDFTIIFDVDNAVTLNVGRATIGFDTSDPPKFQSFAFDNIGGFAVAVSAATVNTGQWYHVVAVKDGTTSLKLYIDGSEDGSDTTSVPDTSSNDTGDRAISIGVDIDGSTFNDWHVDGDIHSVAVWNVALSADEVVTIRNNGNGFNFDLRKDTGDYVSAANVVHWFQLGQPAGGDFPVGTTYVRDRVASGAIDISVNSANISDADIVDTFPGE